MTLLTHALRSLPGVAAAAYMALLHAPPSVTARLVAAAEVRSAADLPEFEQVGADLYHRLKAGRASSTRQIDIPADRERKGECMFVKQGSSLST